MLPSDLKEKQPVGSHKPSVAGGSDNVLDIKSALIRAETNDPRTNARFVSAIKEACLDFRNTPIDFNENKLDQTEILQLNSELLIKI